jgi:hypothetical protein
MPLLGDDIHATRIDGKMTTLSLPEDYDPHTIVEVRAGDEASPDVMDRINDLRNQYKLAGPLLSGNRIDLVNGIWDVVTPYLVGGFWKFLDAVELRRDKMLINYLIERVADKPAEMEEVTCTLMVLSFAHPCTMAINEEYRLHTSWDGPIMLMTAAWKRLTEEQPFVEGMQAQLLEKREKIYGTVPQWIALNTYGFLLNVAALTTVLDQDSLKEYLTRYSFNKNSQLESFCYLLDEFSFDASVPFFGGREFRTFYASSSETRDYLKRRYGSFELIDSYVDGVDLCSQKLTDRWGGSLLEGDAWAKMHAP